MSHSVVIQNADSFARKLRDARSGDAEALGALLEGFRSFLIATANQQLGNDLKQKFGPSDVVQQTFLEAQVDFADFRGETQADLFTWLQQILLNNLHQWAEKFRGTQKRDLEKEVPLQLASANSGTPNDPPLDTPSPSEKVIRNEQLGEVQRALEQLPKEYARVLLLRHQGNKSFAEIGELMQRSAEAVRKLWARAVLLLQQQLETS